jgi:hypothetical protein
MHEHLLHARRSPVCAYIHTCTVQLLDWEDPLPDKEFDLAKDVLSDSELCICLGTSLRIKPASELPLLVKKKGRLVICNLQKTPKDRNANMTIRTTVDKLMVGVMALLDIPIPPAVRLVRLCAGAFYVQRACRVTSVCTCVGALHACAFRAVPYKAHMLYTAYLLTRTHNHHTRRRGAEQEKNMGRGRVVGCRQAVSGTLAKKRDCACISWRGPAWAP